MRESPLRLNDKTVILYGPGHSLTQATGAFLAEQGADVAFVGPEAGSMRMFAENIRDNRQIHPSYGRSAEFETEMKSQEDDLDVISKVAETFGGIEIFIDTHLDPFDSSAFTDTRLRVARSALQFLQGRQRGRILFFTSLYEVVDQEKFEVKTIDDEKVMQVLSDLSTQKFEKNHTINALQIGITEEFFLRQFKEKPLKECLESLKQRYPSFHILEALEVGAFASFIASPISSGLNKQVIQLDKGLIT